MKYGAFINRPTWSSKTNQCVKLEFLFSSECHTALSVSVHRLVQITNYRRWQEQHINQIACLCTVGQTYRVGFHTVLFKKEKEWLCHVLGAFCWSGLDPLVPSTLRVTANQCKVFLPDHLYPMNMVSSRMTIPIDPSLNSSMKMKVM